MHLEQLKYFSEILRCGSINKAAHNLFLSPSALSRSLNNLENELGSKLVIRSNHGVTPTVFGKEVADEVNFILNMIDNYYKKWGNLNSNSHELQSIISIGISPLIDSRPLLQTLIGLKNTYPLLHCQITEMPTKNLIKSLDERKIDLAIISRLSNANSKNKGHFVLDSFLSSKNNWRRTVLGTNRLSILLSRNHVLLSKSSLTLNDLANETILYPDKETHIFEQFSDELSLLKTIPVNSQLMVFQMFANDNFPNLASFTLYSNHLSPLVPLDYEVYPHLIQELLAPINIKNSACEIVYNYIISSYETK